MEQLKQKIEHLAKKFTAEVIEIRREIHRFPELAFQEEKTAALISRKLTEYGISHKKNIAKTGIVGLIEGKNPSKFVLGLRADMDALPILEKNTHEFTSLNPGIMHACGHDVHIASLLGASKILSLLRDQFEGSIKLIFQPSEEKFPGGAKIMIEEGVLESPKVEMMIGQHVLPSMNTGDIGLKEGKYMASTDELYFHVSGKGGHGALPEQNIDPILIASHIVVALQQVVSRNSAPNTPTVVTIGKIYSEGATNITPDFVKMEGILRTFDEQWRASALEKIDRIASGIAQSMGGDCRLKINHGYPVLINNPKVTESTRHFAETYLGESHVQKLDIRMTSEDFAFFSHKIPSCFYRLGVRNETKGMVSNLHSSTFDADEDCFPTSIGLMAWIAINHMQNH